MSDSPDVVLVRVLEKLWEAQGRPQSEGSDDVLGVLVRMMLAQATSKPNATRAFGDLLDRFGGEWERVHRAAVGELAASIEVGGLSAQKAPRIQALLARTVDDFGEYSLEAVRRMSVEAALDYLLGFDGVGPTTAKFTLMAAAGMDIFPINGGIRRVLERLGVPADPLLPAGWAYAVHMTLVRHARTTCKPTPLCEHCVASSVCPHFWARRD